MFKKIRRGWRQWNRRPANFPSPRLRLLSRRLLRCSLSFRLSKDGDARAKCDKAYAIAGRFKDAKRKLRIGVLPWGPPGSDREETPRGGNFITLPGHPLWDINTTEEVWGFAHRGCTSGSVINNKQRASREGELVLANFARNLSSSCDRLPVA